MSKYGRLIGKYYPYVVLGGAFLVLLFWNAFYLEHWLDSDMAAEMMFSKLLAEGICRYGLVLFHGVPIFIYASDHGTAISGL